MRQIKRRSFLSSGMAVIAATVPGVVMAGPTSDQSMWERWDSQVTPENYDPETSNPWGLDARYLPQQVVVRSDLSPGDVHVDAASRFLYHIHTDATATRYGVAIAKGNLYEPGIYTIKRRAKWPTWTPTASMIERDPDAYASFANGMDGGPANPLGSRALYLYEGDRDTYLRIHGTPDPGSIGTQASQGCVRMVMAHIIDLHAVIRNGATAYLHSPDDTTLSLEV